MEEEEEERVEEEKEPVVTAQGEPNDEGIDAGAYSTGSSLEKEFTSESSYLSPEMPGNGLHSSIILLFFLQRITIFHDLNVICNDIKTFLSYTRQKTPFKSPNFEPSQGCEIGACFLYCHIFSCWASGRGQRNLKEN